ncbi:MAG: TldD/PmbA family protein [Myxococcota bacterium]|nr:TldD/PmbA family protein [Myxococcota bacterium]
MSHNLLQAAKDAAKLARRCGADDAQIAVSRSRGVDIEWRDGKLERVQERTRQSLSVEVYVNGRFSASSTCDLRPSALQDFFRDAVDMTRLLQPDPHRGLPELSEYGERADVDLDLNDQTYPNVESERRRQEAQDLEARVRDHAADLPIVSVATTVSDGTGQSARVHTNGFEGERQGTHFSASAVVTVMDTDGKRPLGWAYSSRRHRSDLEDFQSIADRARLRAQNQLGAGRVKTGKYTVVVAREAIPRLLNAFLSPIGGPALQQRQSLWEGKLNTQIASPLLTIWDQPHVVRGLGSALWDSDGYATAPRPIIEDGVLKTYLIDRYYALKMETQRTGSDTHNLEWAIGDRDADSLVADVGHGVYIERFLGGNSNGTTGDMSFGCAGRLIENGALAGSITEANLSGHFGELWRSLVAVGNDPNPNGTGGCPTCVFEGVQLSGD